MRPLTALMIFSLALGSPGPLWAQGSAEKEGTGASNPAHPAPRLDSTAQRAELLDRLFGRLKSVSNDAEGQVIEQSIWNVWMSSGSPTADVLLEQAIKAMNARSYNTALDILDAIIDANPDFAEAWNKRATVNYIIGKLDQSLADIDKVLEREPRHFGALAGLGMIRRDRGDDRGALEAFRQALAINPFMPSVREAVGELEKKLEQGI